MCAPKDNDEYVVPDYIFVHKDYSFSNPINPLLMVETKNPVIIKDETFYQKLSGFVTRRTVAVKGLNNQAQLIKLFNTAAENYK